MREEGRLATAERIMHTDDFGSTHNPYAKCEDFHRQKIGKLVLFYGSVK
jgi:hypothetical protein